MRSDGGKRPAGGRDRAARVLETFGFEKRLCFFHEQLRLERERIGRPLAIIDVGCGTGEAVTIPLADSADSIVGLDVHIPSLMVGARHKPGRFVCAETRALRSASFDVAVCSEVLEHVDSPAALLADVRRLLRPGGLCLATVPNGYGPYEAADRAGKLAHAALHMFGLEQGSDTPNMPACRGCDSLNYSCGHLHFFSPTAIKRLFSAGGFDQVAYRGRTFLCGPLLSEALSLHDVLVDLNARAGTYLPQAVVSGWMFALQAPGAHGRPAFA